MHIVTAILIILLVLMIIGGLPSVGWPTYVGGYYPYGGFGLILVIILIVLLLR